MKEKRLSIPLSEEDVRGLALGDVVWLDGPVYTGRSLFHIRAVDQDIFPPLDYASMNVLLHIGPVMVQKNGEWKPVSMAPTSSIRFEKYGAGVIRKLGVRAVIGKTTMGPGSAAAMKEVGCVHLTVVGIMGNLLAKAVRRVPEVHFLGELGKTEATWVMELEKGGPFIVDMDARGNNLFHQVNAGVEEKFKEFHARLGIQPDFRYTDVNS